MNKHKQKGVAMLLAMTAMAFMTIMATSLLFTQQINVRRTANILHGDQAHLFTLAVERMGLILLQRDKKDGDVDHMGEHWANFAVGVAMIQSEMDDHITLSGKIEDLQGKFNLNNLIDSKGKKSKIDLRMFKHLLDILELEQNLANAIVDWIDEDLDLTFPDGAEDGEYLNLDLPYRTANRPMLSPTELFLIKGIDQEIYKKLIPFVTVLPKRTKININTAPAEVLAMLSDQLKLEDGKDIVKEREENYKDGFAKVGEFAKLPVISALTKKDKKVKGDLVDNYDIGSEYFMIAASAIFGEGHMQLFSIVSRDKNKTHVVHRGQGSY